jgi:hypothetical protein
MRTVKRRTIFVKLPVAFIGWDHCKFRSCRRQDRFDIAADRPIGISIDVAAHAIHDASSADTEKAPAMSAISRSTSCEEMLEPTIAIAITPIVHGLLRVRHL